MSADQKSIAPTEMFVSIRIEEADLRDPSDCSAVVEIIDSYARGSGGQGAPLSEDAKTRMCNGLLSNPCAMVLIATLSGRKVGVAVCFWGFATFAGKPAINIHDLAVLPEFQGKGIGHALMAEVENRARASECCRVTLEVNDSNEGAKRLYASQGFGPWDPQTLFVSKYL